MRTLLVLKDQKTFVDSCGRVGLASALVNAMRLLRMFEIKRSKLLGSGSSAGQSGESVTFSASKSSSVILAKLCSEPLTVEQLKPFLVKLLCYPVGSLPLSGLHLQTHCASIISSICRDGLSSSLVWFLHDVQAITHLLNHMSELCGYMAEAKSPSASDLMLQQASAEEKGMWLTAVTCIIDLISFGATASSSTIFHSDFEAADGVKIFEYVLHHSSPERSIVMMSVISRLLFDESKEVDEPTCHPSMGAIFSTLLIKYLEIELPIQKEYAMEELTAITRDIHSRRARLLSKEYLLQNLVFTLLTLYSNNSKNCTILEETYAFLPTVIVALPA